MWTPLPRWQALRGKARVEVRRQASAIRNSATDATRRQGITIISIRSTHLDEAPVDEDLLHLDRDALMAEVKRLRAGIREHRDSSGHELCWHHPKLWGLLPEKTDPLPSVPAWPQFLRGCLKYRESLDTQLPNAPRTEREFDR